MFLTPLQTQSNDTDTIAVTEHLTVPHHQPLLRPPPPPPPPPKAPVLSSSVMRACSAGGELGSGFHSDDESGHMAISFPTEARENSSC